MKLTINGASNAMGYVVERRIMFKDGSGTLWQKWLTFEPLDPTVPQVLSAPDKDGAPGFSYQYRAYKDTLRAKAWFR